MSETEKKYTINDVPPCDHCHHPYLVHSADQGCLMLGCGDHFHLNEDTIAQWVIDHP